MYQAIRNVSNRCHCYRSDLIMNCKNPMSIKIIQFCTAVEPLGQDAKRQFCGNLWTVTVCGARLLDEVGDLWESSSYLYIYCGLMALIDL